MAININIPMPTQSLGQTWSPIQQNFNAIQAAWVVNHVDYNSVSPLAGKHTYVTMPAQTTPPGTLATEQAIFCQNDGFGNPQLFVQSPSAAALYNITGAYFNPVLPWALGSQGSLTLPSGIIVKWGFAQSSGAGLATVSFTSAFPNAIFTAYATISDIGGTNASSADNVARIYNFTNSLISVVTYFENTARSRVSDTFSWLVIGY